MHLRKNDTEVQRHSWWNDTRKETRVRTHAALEDKSVPVTRSRVDILNSNGITGEISEIEVYVSQCKTPRHSLPKWYIKTVVLCY